MKLNVTLKKPFVKASLLSLLSALLLSSVAFTQEDKRDHSKTGQVAGAADSKDSMRIETNSETQPGAPLLLTAAPGAATFGAALTVQVDHSYCATGGIQCFIPGQAPGDANRNPVRLGIQVLSGSTPVTTLTDADIDVVNNFVPAGGATVSQIACGSCFQNAGNGVYSIFVAPGAGQTWKPGSYFVQVRVNVGGTLQRALAQIEIPF